MLNQNTIVAFFDGACWPNPGGEMGTGAVILKNGETIFEHAEAIKANPGNSNNVAEYLAFSKILDWLIENPQNSPVEIYGDSNLLIQQMQGKWRIKSGNYAKHAHEAKTSLSRLNNVSLHWIPREDNEIADSLSKRHVGCCPK